MPRSALVLAVGAAAYAVLVGGLGVTFDVTPLAIGVVALAAATIGGAYRLTATALALVGWGAAVMLVRHGPLPAEREAAAFLVGAAAGLLVARVPWRGPRRSLGDGATVLLVGGLAFYAAFDASWVYDWPLWTAVLAGWAGWEAVRGRR